MTDAPRILELGEFAHFKRAWPERTDFVFTGDNPARVRDVEHRSFGVAEAARLLRALRRGDYDAVFVHAPARPLWDPARGPLRAAAGFLRRLAGVRTLGTRLLRARPAAAFAVLDFHDAATIPAPALPLLAACDAYFKRELPLDPALAFIGASRRPLTPDDVECDPVFRRHAGKLEPVALAVPEAFAQAALRADGRKTTDVFFAGTLAHSARRERGATELAALAGRGVMVDLCAGGLPRDTYVARMARARLAWSPPGLGWDCFRHCEAALCGAVPILSAPSIRRHRPLEDGVHAFVHDDRDGALAATVLRALADPDAIGRMATAARAHALAHHTHARSCESILERTLRAAGGRR